MAEIITEPIEKYGLSQHARPKVLFSRVGIVGCGTVGQELAITISKQGIDVAFLELNDQLVQHSLDEIKKQLDYEINHWGLTPGEKNAILSRIRGTLQYSDFANCDLVIETIKSKQGGSSFVVRKEVFRNIEKYVDKNCIIATNSSTIMVTELSSELTYNDRCISFHISTTAPGASVVELAKSLHTSDEVYAKVAQFVKLLDKIPIEVTESPGLISVRLYVVLLNEACEALMEGVSTMENIDLTMRSSFNMPLGPFEFADKVGLDKIIRWMENLYGEFGSTRYIPNPIIKKLFRANRFGRVSGIGFYEYGPDGNKITNETCC